DSRPHRLRRFLPKELDDACGLRGWNKTLARLPEDKAEPIRASLNRGARFGQRAQAADLNQGHVRARPAVIGAPASTRLRNLTPGSGERRSDSPIRMASTPAANRT